MQRGDGDVILLDVQLPDGYGPNLLYEAANLPVRPPIILITAYGDIEMAVDAMKNGAHDFLTKPIQFSQLEKSLQRACEIVSMRRELTHLRETQKRTGNLVVGSSRFKTVLNQAQRAATASVSVLIPVKPVPGRRCWRSLSTSPVRARISPLLRSTVPPSRAPCSRSELFGYEAGAFTGAERRKHGLMEVADGGVLFLDEISSMPLDIQAKLLRALEERSFRRVGGTT